MPEPTETITPVLTIEQPPDWVPVERRWLGMDRRTLLPAGLVVLLVVVTFWVLPFIDSHTATDHPIHAGDIVRVDGVEFVPATGWNLEAGLLAGTASAGSYPDQATLSHSGVTFSVETGSFTGTATDLLQQIEKNNDKLGADGVDFESGPVAVFESTRGERGVLARFSTTTAEGLIGALVLTGTGVQITVYGPKSLDSDPALESDVVSMIRSIQLVDGAAS
jgi:hypothetical protein